VSPWYTPDEDWVRIADLQRVTVNGQERLTFKAYIRQGGAFVFAGSFSAPPDATDEDMVRIALERAAGGDS
jgi:hypothetical protein